MKKDALSPLLHHHLGRLTYLSSTCGAEQDYRGICSGLLLLSYLLMFGYKPFYHILKNTPHRSRSFALKLFLFSVVIILEIQVKATIHNHA